MSKQVSKRLPNDISLIDANVHSVNFDSFIGRVNVSHSNHSKGSEESGMGSMWIPNK